MVNDDSKNEPILESANLVLLLVAEMREQRIGFKDERLVLERDRKFARRLNMAFRSVLVLMPLLFGLYFLLQVSGSRLGAFSSLIGIAHIDGEISSTSKVSADKLFSLDRARF